MGTHKMVALITVSKLLLLILLTIFSISTPGSAQNECSNIEASEFGLLVNFSVPCDLPTEIAIPDRGGLLTPNLLGVGYQEYSYNGSAWVYMTHVATLYNKTLDRVGSLSGTPDGGFAMTFDVNTSVVLRAAPLVEVLQRFSIPLQLLNVTNSSPDIPYGFADYVQRFGTILGLPPTEDFPAQAGDGFKSKFAAFYAFYLPFDLSPQLATRVPRCGDERFYGLQDL